MKRRNALIVMAFINSGLTAKLAGTQNRKRIEDMTRFAAISLTAAIVIAFASSLWAEGPTIPAPASWMGGDDYYSGQDEFMGGDAPGETPAVQVSAPIVENYITVYETRQVCENGVCRMVSIPVRKRVTNSGVVVARPVVFPAMANSYVQGVQCANCGRVRVNSCVGGMSWGYKSNYSGTYSGARSSMYNHLIGPPHYISPARLAGMSEGQLNQLHNQLHGWGGGSAMGYGGTAWGGKSLAAYRADRWRNRPGLFGWRWRRGLCR